MKKIDYAALYTLRKDGRYQGSYTDDKGRHYVYDRDPEKLWHKLQRAAAPEPEPTFGDVAKAWEREHREKITSRTWNNYKPHYEAIIARHGERCTAEVSAQDVLNHLLEAKSKGYGATVVNSIRSLYRMIFDYAIVHGYAQFNPVTSVRLPRGLKRGGDDGHARGLAQLKLASHDADAVALAAFDRARLSPGLAHRPIGADVGADAAGVADLGKEHRRALHEHQGVKAAALDAFAAAAALFTVEFRHFPLYHAARDIFRAEKQAAVRLLDVAVNIGGAPRSAG